MARSTFYHRLARAREPDKHAALRRRILTLFHTHKGRYGYRRITLALHNEGYWVNHKRVERIMREVGIKSAQRKVRYRSYKGEVGRIAPNLLQREFATDVPNRKWATDVTQVNIEGRKCYLSPVLDMYNGEIISYTISEHPDLKLVTEMLGKALAKVTNTKGLMLHSDQGWHYQHAMYRRMLEESGVVQSMSRKGNCLDNAVMENFFGIMKSELLYLQKWKSIEQFKFELKEYIRYYNNDRIKAKLKGMSPVKYRTHSLQI